MILKKAIPEDFELIYSEMEKNFIPDEIRERTDAKKAFSNDAYTVYHAIENTTRVGFITVWELSDVTFAEHFVIYEKYRNKGYGRAVLDALKEKHTKIVLEVEHPNTDMQKRRLNFYLRSGFVINDVPYMQPSYKEDGCEVPLIIMSYPCQLQCFCDTVSEIKQKVYNKT